MAAARHPDRSILIERLHRVPVFQRLDTEILHQLADSAIWREFSTGAILFLEGDIAEGFYFISWGWLKEVKSSSEGREQILQVLGPGEIFNYMGIFVDRPNPATVIALEPTGIWVFKREAFYTALAAHPDLALRVAEALADQVSHLIQLVSDLSLQSVENRLAQRLLDYAEADVVYRQRWATQAEMAAQLGTVPDVLSRALRKFGEEKLIRVERQQIHILDRPGLTAKTAL